MEEQDDPPLLLVAGEDEEWGAGQWGRGSSR
jgi:hypothetical protein